MNNQEVREAAQHVRATTTSYNIRRLALVAIELVARVEALEQQLAARPTAGKDERP